MGISGWRKEDRPRERLLAHGPEKLRDEELVAVLLRTGVRGKSAVELGRELLERHGGFGGLFNADALAGKVKGIGPSKKAHLLAALEISKRFLLERSKAASTLTSPGAVRDYLRLLLATREHEVFVCIWLDAQHRVLEADELFRGTLTQTSVYPREVVKRALRVNAAAVIFAHNHPSGAAQPSPADELLTRTLKETLALVEVRVLDHFVVAGKQGISFAERGLL